MKKEQKIFTLTLLSIFLISALVNAEISIFDDINYELGGVINGDFDLRLDRGELIPADSKFIINLGTQERNLKLSEVVDVDSTSGNFYVEDLNISGFGEGYGKPEEVRRDMVAVDTLQKAGKSVDDVPEHVTNALTRDYSDLMKAIDKKG